MSIQLSKKAKAWIGFTSKVACGLGIVWLLFLNIDLAQVWSIVVTVEISRLIAAIVLTLIGGIVIPAIVTKLSANKDRFVISLVSLICLNLVTRFYVLILPRMFAIGIRWARYRKISSGSDAFAMLAFERFIQLFIFTLIGSIALVTEWDNMSGKGTTIIFAGIALALASGSCLLPFLSKTTAAFLETACNKLRISEAHWLGSPIRRLLKAIYQFQKLSRNRRIKIVSITILSYLLLVIPAMILANGVSIDLPLAAMAWIRPYVFILTLIPITIGGIGTREIGFVTLLSLYGVPAYEALALSLLLLFVQICLGALGAGLELLRVAGNASGSWPRRRVRNGNA